LDLQATLLSSASTTRRRLVDFFFFFLFLRPFRSFQPTRRRNPQSFTHFIDLKDTPFRLHHGPPRRHRCSGLYVSHTCLDQREPLTDTIQLPPRPWPSETRREPRTSATEPAASS